MTIANPFAWGLLLLAIPIVLFFFLKIRFRKEFVTTTIFWQQVFDERRSRRLYRRFRHLLSLFLALLFLTFLIAALLDPVFSVTGSSRCVIIIDNSASMNALHPSSNATRLDSVKRQAQQRLDTLAAGQQVAILTATIPPKIVSGFTDHSGTLRQKLAEVAATDSPADMAAALRLAEQLLAGRQDAPVYVYTDTEPIDNVAITRFQPRRLPEHATDYEIFVEVINFGTETVHTHLEIDCDGSLVDVLPLSLEPNKTVTKIVRGTSEGGLFQATLASSDLLPADNVAVAFLSKRFVQRIFLYGMENYFLHHVLQAQPQTEVTLARTIPNPLPPDSVLVCHQTVPQTLPPGNIIVIDPQNDSDLFRVGERLERPVATDVDTDNPLVRFAQFSGMVFVGAKQIVPQKNGVKMLVATADDFPLYMQFTSDNQRTLVLSADLNQGDFALRTAFPILVSQALTSFRNSADLQKAYSTAEPVTLSLQTEKPLVILRSPSGREEVFPCQSGAVSLGRLSECGLWTVLEPESGRELTRIACNLFNATESHLRGEGATAISPEKLAATPRFVRPIWFVLTLLALFLTVAEWFLYQRRWIE